MDGPDTIALRIALQCVVHRERRNFDRLKATLVKPASDQVESIFADAAPCRAAPGTRKMQGDHAAMPLGAIAAASVQEPGIKEQAVARRHLHRHRLIMELLIALDTLCRDGAEVDALAHFVLANIQPMRTGHDA